MRTYFVGLAVLVVACSSDDPKLSGASAGAAGSAGSAGVAGSGAGGSALVCAPGKQEACACPGGVEGAQRCRDDGNGWEGCVCPDAGVGGAAGSDGGTDAGAGGVAGAAGSDGGMVSCPIVSGASTMVGLGGFCVDRVEVTRGQYQAWLESNPNPDAQAAMCAHNEDFTPTIWPPGPTDLALPVVTVDWCDAHAYCQGMGKRLCGAIGGGSAPIHSWADPTVSQWYAACSGGTAFPYGDTYDPHACNGHGNEVYAPVDGGSLPDCRPDVGPIFDMSGNVWEWTDECNGDRCLLRGGAFIAQEEMLRCDYKNDTQTREYSSHTIGFRCCAD